MSKIRFTKFAHGYSAALVDGHTVAGITKDLEYDDDTRREYLVSYTVFQSPHPRRTFWVHDYQGNALLALNAAKAWVRERHNETK